MTKINVFLVDEVLVFVLVDEKALVVLVLSSSSSRFTGLVSNYKTLEQQTSHS